MATLLSIHTSQHEHPGQANISACQRYTRFETMRSVCLIAHLHSKSGVLNNLRWDESARADSETATRVPSLFVRRVSEFNHFNPLIIRGRSHQRCIDCRQGTDRQSCTRKMNNRLPSGRTERMQLVRSHVQGSSILARHRREPFCLFALSFAGDAMHILRLLRNIYYCGTSPCLYLNTLLT
jgi:hypothetical protein